MVQAEEIKLYLDLDDSYTVVQMENFMPEDYDEKIYPGMMQDGRRFMFIYFRAKKRVIFWVDYPGSNKSM